MIEGIIIYVKKREVVDQQTAVEDEITRSFREWQVDAKTLKSSTDCGSLIQLKIWSAELKRYKVFSYLELPISITLKVGQAMTFSIGPNLRKDASSSVCRRDRPAACR